MNPGYQYGHHQTHMQITIDPGSGFCFGVKNAVEQADKALDQGLDLYCLGEIVHNPEELGRLKKKGMKVITHGDLASLEGQTVLIRAHGEPPSTFELAKKYDIKLVDATCPVVQKIQQRVERSYREGLASSAQVVIFGKPGHAEVLGLTGQTGDNAIVIASVKELDRINFSKPVRLYSQTTMNKEVYRELAGEIRIRMQQAGNEDLEINQTICGQVAGRAPKLREFAAHHEVILFVSGRNSSNGAYLYSIAKEVNPRSYLVSSPGDIEASWLLNASSVGISGATSTPVHQMEEIAAYLRQLFA